MARNPDLIHRILKDIEASPPGKSVDKLEYPEYEKEIVYEHVKILEDEGLIDAKTIRKGIPKTVRKFWITGLTPNGNKFLEDIGNNSLLESSLPVRILNPVGRFWMRHWQWIIGLAVTTIIGIIGLYLLWLQLKAIPK